jgi:DNA repair protein RecN (Recombination protein N)
VLRELHISGLGVIEDLEVELHPGLNVLSGETGTGKTMVTVALSLALGDRGSATLVRAGADRARVEARFEAPRTPAAQEWAEDGEVILARTVTPDGRSTARIGGQMVPLSALAALRHDLVEVQGQNQAGRLRSGADQTAFLDRFAGREHLVRLDEYVDRYDRLSRVRTRLEELLREAREREREKDLLAYQVREIEGAGLAPGEMTSLSGEEAGLAHAERLLELSSSAEAALLEEWGGADRLREAASALSEAGRLDPRAAELATRARSAAEEVGEVGASLRAYRESLRVDPERLDTVRERIQALKALERKYGEGEEGILAFLEEARDRLARLSGVDDERVALEQEAAALAEQAEELARGLSEAREAAATPLGSALEAELSELGMEGASVRVVLRPHPELERAGRERVELLFSGGRGQAALPLARVASGGELSRLMLACRSVLADLDAVPSLVFDEVDAGIGGRAGLAVGRRLARLAESRQVLVVTHLPQIACFAHRHLRVDKRAGRATVSVVEGPERVVELSRMLSGLSDSESAAIHAEELLAEAAADRAPSETEPVRQPNRR